LFGREGMGREILSTDEPTTRKGGPDECGGRECGWFPRKRDE